MIETIQDGGRLATAAVRTGRRERGLGSPASAGGARLWDHIAQTLRRLDAGQDALLWLDARENVVLCNPAAERLFGRLRGAIEGERWEALIAEHSREVLRRTLRMLDRERPDGGVSLDKAGVVGARWDGSELPLDGGANLFRLGSRVRYLLLLRDATARTEIEKRLLHMAQHDHLTGLPNRSLFTDRLEGAVRRHRRSGRSFALLFIDLDNFKSINDTFGHLAGDRVLRRCATRLNACVRDSDSAARLGGDELAVILEEMEDEAEVCAAIGRIGAALSQPMLFDWATIRLSASIGHALYPRDGTVPSELLRCADVAMYRVKNAARNSRCDLLQPPREPEQAAIRTAGARPGHP